MQKEQKKMNISIIGTGRVGTALAQRWTASGHSVMFGTRDPNAMHVKAAVAANPPARAGAITEAAAFGRIVLLAVPGHVTLDTVRACGDLRSKIVIDAANWFGTKPAGVTTSIAEAIAEIAPGAKVIKAFNMTGTGNMADPDYNGVKADLFICGDEAAAKIVVTDLATNIGFNVIDAGPLSAAGLLESMAQLWVHLAYTQGLGPNIAWKLLKR